VLEAEKKFLSSLLANYYGKQALLIGTPHQQVLLKSSVVPHHVLLSPLLSHVHRKDTASIESELNELPIASGSIDLVVLPHILEYYDNPRQLLAESCRIVKPEGHIVICGFNPYSLWGIRWLLSNKKNVPWSGNFIKPTLAKAWLALADFKLIKQTTLFYRPPMSYEKLYQKLKFMEWLGRKLHLPWGGVYVLVAQAKVIPLTPIKLRWQQKLSGIHVPTVGIPGPSIRNNHS
jgi:SAM-dependent methyltransferase